MLSFASSYLWGIWTHIRETSLLTQQEQCTHELTEAVLTCNRHEHIWASHSLTLKAMPLYGYFDFYEDANSVVSLGVDTLLCEAEK